MNKHHHSKLSTRESAKLSKLKKKTLLKEQCTGWNLCSCSFFCEGTSKSEQLSTLWTQKMEFRSERELSRRGSKSVYRFHPNHSLIPELHVLQGVREKKYLEAPKTKGKFQLLAHQRGDRVRSCSSANLAKILH